jgi:crossover junction endodeoxyribonuclease RuvC
VWGDPDASGVRELTRIMGIDPGTRVMGYGVLEERNGDLTLVDYGVLTAPHGADVIQRLRHLYHGTREVLARHRPDVLAIEEPFVGTYVQAALAVGRAQAIAILAAANEDIPVFAYTPAQVKQRVANYGGSGKAQIQEMVRLQLGMASVPEPNDAADALAVAICHCCESRLAALLRQGRK